MEWTTDPQEPLHQKLIDELAEQSLHPLVTYYGRNLYHYQVLLPEGMEPKPQWRSYLDKISYTPLTLTVSQVRLDDVDLLARFTRALTSKVFGMEADYTEKIIMEAYTTPTTIEATYVPATSELEDVTIVPIPFYVSEDQEASYRARCDATPFRGCGFLTSHPLATTALLQLTEATLAPFTIIEKEGVYGYQGPINSDLESNLHEDLNLALLNLEAAQTKAYAPITPLAQEVATMWDLKLLPGSYQSGPFKLDLDLAVTQIQRGQLPIVYLAGPGLREDSEMLLLQYASLRTYQEIIDKINSGLESFREQVKVLVDGTIALPLSHISEARYFQSRIKELWSRKPHWQVQAVANMTEGYRLQGKAFLLDSKSEPMVLTTKGGPYLVYESEDPLTLEDGTYEIDEGEIRSHSRVSVTIPVGTFRLITPDPNNPNNKKGLLVTPEGKEITIRIPEGKITQAEAERNWREGHYLNPWSQSYYLHTNKYSSSLGK